MLTLRPAQPLDIPAIFCLIDDHRGKLFDDRTVFDLEEVSARVFRGEMLVIEGESLVAAFWLFNYEPDLFVMVNGVIEPKHLRAVLASGLLEEIITDTFRVGVGKIKVAVMPHQTTAIKLLRRFHFMGHEPLFKEAKHNGAKTDIIWFELRRNYWKRVNA